MYVTLQNGIEVLVDMEEVEPVVDYSGVNLYPPEKAYPPEITNEDEIEQAIEDAEYWLWDEGVLQLPADHRYSEEALQININLLGW